MRSIIERYPGVIVLLVLTCYQGLGFAQTPTAFVADYFGLSSTLDGRSLLSSDTVTVRDPQGVLAGVQFAFPGGGGYAAHVYGDDPVTPDDEGASEGDTLRFFINGYKAQIVSGDPAWHHGASVRLELSAASSETTPVLHILEPGQHLEIHRGTTLLFRVQGFNPSGGPLTYTWSVDGAVQADEADSVFTYTADSPGLHSVAVTASNGVASASYLWTVKVEEILTPTAFVADYFGLSSTLDGRSLLSSDTVTVRDPQGVLAGVQFAFPGGGGYAAHVYGDDPVTPDDEGASEGDTLRFFINGYKAQIVSGDPAWHHGASQNLELKAFSGMGDTLALGDALGRRGQTVTIPVVLRNVKRLTRVVFSIQPASNEIPSPALQFASLTNHLESTGFGVSHQTDESGRTAVVFSAPDGVSLDEGVHEILDLIFTVNGNLDSRLTVDLQLVTGSLTDAETQIHTPVLRSSKVHVGISGDMTGGPGGIADGRLDVFDVIGIINIILNTGSEPDAVDIFFADLNDDSKVNILDVVRLIRQILGFSSPKSTASAGPISATIYLDPIRFGANGDPVLPIMIDSNGSIAAVQVTLRYDPGLVDAGTPIPADRAGHMMVLSQKDDGILRIVLANLTGSGIPSGSGVAINLPLKWRYDGPGRSDGFSISEALMADWEARDVVLNVRNSVLTPERLPETHSLKDARPNPFNPSAVIAYETPQQAHIRLVVYNVLGQEIARLVDGIQPPGRYQVKWDGRNEQGVSVASGIYLYRLSSSTGYIETKRMTLLK